MARQLEQHTLALDEVNREVERVGETLSFATVDLEEWNPLDERVIASPAIAGERIFVRTDRHLVAIGE